MKNVNPLRSVITEEIVEIDLDSFQIHCHIFNGSRTDCGMPIGEAIVHTLTTQFLTSVLSRRTCSKGHVLCPTCLFNARLRL